MAKTIGLVAVATLAAIAGTVPPAATMTETLLRTRSLARVGSRSSWFRPSGIRSRRFLPRHSHLSQPLMKSAQSFGEPVERSAAEKANHRDPLAGAQREPRRRSADAKAR